MVDAVTRRLLGVAREIRGPGRRAPKNTSRVVLASLLQSGVDVNKLLFALALALASACTPPHDSITAFASGSSPEFPSALELFVGGGHWELTSIADIGDESGEKFHAFHFVLASFEADEGSRCSATSAFRCSGDGTCRAAGELLGEGLCAGTLHVEDDAGETWEPRICSVFALGRALDGRPILRNSQHCSVAENVRVPSDLDKQCLELREQAEDLCG